MLRMSDLFTRFRHAWQDKFYALSDDLPFTLEDFELFKRKVEESLDKIENISEIDKSLILFPISLLNDNSNRIRIL